MHIGADNVAESGLLALVVDDSRPVRDGVELRRLNPYGQGVAALAERKEVAMMWWYGNGMGAWGYLVMTVSLVLFWGLAIFALIALARYIARPAHTAGPRPPAPADSSPEHLLAQRFAQGEIDEQEYRQRLDVLREQMKRSIDR